MKVNMATCNGNIAKPGNSSRSNCGGILYKCPKCGLAGCKNVSNGVRCSNNITKDSGGGCRNCGSQLKSL